MFQVLVLQIGEKEKSERRTTDLQVQLFQEAKVPRVLKHQNARLQPQKPVPGLQKQGSLPKTP